MDELQAVLWVRSSAEYRVLSEQIYRSAAAALASALADTTVTAALEQGPGFGRLPPAVIVDVDETVLDHSEYASLLLRTGHAFDYATNWRSWVEERAAPPVPGALRFLRTAADLGVAVFYVTNNGPELEDAIRANLARIGFPLDPELDTVLMKDEWEDWTWDKSARRRFVARCFRVLLLIGDDLNDFLPARVSPEERHALAERESERWGRSWILLPNPVYGSWADALWDFRAGVTLEERHRLRRRALEAAEGAVQHSHEVEAP